MPDHTTTSAAAELGVTRRQIVKLIHEGKLQAEKHGRDWSVSAESIEGYKGERRKAGRPRKGTDQDTNGGASEDTRQIAEE